MTPEEFAARVPRLYHVTDRPAWPSIERHGLLSADRLIDRFVEDAERRTTLKTERRKRPVPLHEDADGTVLLNDNIPLIFSQLARILDDGLTPEDWLRILNRRVYFFPPIKHAANFIEAGRRGGRKKLLLTFDARSVAESHLDRLFVAPINTGSAIRFPARRGHEIFAPVASIGWDDFASRRAAVKRSPDQVAEVSMLDGLPAVARHLARSPEAI